MATAPFYLQQFRFSDDSPASGGRLYAYVQGTTTPATVYLDHGLTTPAANPIILSSEGIVPQFFVGTAGLSFVLKDPRNGLETEVWTRDYVVAGGGGGGGSGTVTSVSAAFDSGLSSAFAVTSAPVTASGDIMISGVSGSKRRALMTPNDGNGKPSMREILPSDVAGGLVEVKAFAANGDSSPASPVVGTYALAFGMAGAWIGHDNALATWDGSAWSFANPQKNQLVYCAQNYYDTGNTAGLFYWGGSSSPTWVALSYKRVNATDIKAANDAYAIRFIAKDDSEPSVFTNLNPANIYMVDRFGNNLTLGGSGLYYNGSLGTAGYWSNGLTLDTETGSETWSVSAGIFTKKNITADGFVQSPSVRPQNLSQYKLPRFDGMQLADSAFSDDGTSVKLGRYAVIKDGAYISGTATETLGAGALLSLANGAGDIGGTSAWVAQLITNTRLRWFSYEPALGYLPRVEFSKFGRITGWGTEPVRSGIATTTGLRSITTTTETSLLSAGAQTLAANRLGNAGTMVRGDFSGILNCSNGQTLRIRCYLGATTVLDSTATLPAITNGAWTVDYKLIVPTVGASGTYYMWAVLRCTESSGAYTYIKGFGVGAMTTTGAIDTTVSNTLDVTAQLGTASGSMLIGPASLEGV